MIHARYSVMLYLAVAGNTQYAIIIHVGITRVYEYDKHCIGCGYIIVYDPVEKWLG